MVWGKTTEDVPSDFGLTTHLGDPDEAYGFWLWLGPPLAIEAILGSEEVNEVLSLCVSPSLSPSSFQINEWIFFKCTHLQCTFLILHIHIYTAYSEFSDLLKEVLFTPNLLCKFYLYKPHSY